MLASIAPAEVLSGVEHEPICCKWQLMVNAETDRQTREVLASDFAGHIKLLCALLRKINLYRKQGVVMWSSRQIHPSQPLESMSLPDRPYFFAAVTFAIAGFLTLFIDWRLRVLAADDSYIHLRIAQHLIGNGYAFFNAHERVMVTSSPLWTLLLAISDRLSGNFPPALPLEALAVGGSCAFSLMLASALSRGQFKKASIRAAYQILVPCITFLLLLQSSIIQMETPLAVALVLAGLLFWYYDSDCWLTILVLAAWVRYEYFPLVVLFAIFALLKRRLTAKSVLLAAVNFVVGTIWLIYQYGTVVPNTVKAKAIAYIIPWSVTFRALGLGFIRCSLLVLVIAGLISVRPFSRLTSAMTVLFAGGLLLDILYIIRKTFIFPWYTPLVLIPICLGLLLGPGLFCKGWVRITAIFTAIVFVPVHALPKEFSAAVTGQPWRDDADDFNIRAREYILIGRALNGVCPQARLLTSEIGGLGYGFPGEILDGLGLASPAASKYHPMRVPEERKDGANGAIPYGFVQETLPDVIVTYDDFSESLRRHYDHTVYKVFEYPPLPLSEGPLYPLWSSFRMFVFVSNNGRCDAQAIDSAIRAATKNE